MPIMDGFEATRRIREEEEYYGVRIPIIALSAHTNSPEIRMMVQAGMDRHLPKPLTPANLLEVITDIQRR